MMLDPTQEEAPAAWSGNSPLVVAAAHRWLGTPYHDQASVRGVGCDCLGLARGAWREVVGPESMPIPRCSATIWMA
jgi:cell wall-associated NlpC family hydrolase